jgi:hypothetical protein
MINCNITINTIKTKKGLQEHLVNLFSYYLFKLYLSKTSKVEFMLLNSGTMTFIFATISSL